MSVSRHHADWLSIVEVSGPFVSMPVLQRVFPQGLEGRDPAQAKALRAAYEEWQDNPTAPGKQRAWVLHILSKVLGYPPDQIAEGQMVQAGLEAAMPEMGETLRPEFALVDSAGGQAHLLVASYHAEQALDRPVIAKHWKATPATRMTELLRGTGIPLGLVTNGEHWMLVYAPRGETTGYASWYAALWMDEPITLRAFHSLLGVRRFFGVAAESTLLALLKESASDQQEVTDQLGFQVREAVEVLVQSFDAMDKENSRSLLGGVSETALYDAALTVMMRLVFLFSAEERGLLHLGKPIYDDNYAVSTLQEQLQEDADRDGEEVLERRSDAWARLLATFRAVHGGIQHQDLLMQAYGGSLFSPDRYPFLEGRHAGSAWQSDAAEPPAVNNRVVLHLLNSLQRLRTRIGAGGTAETRRISFRALGVEQIGHVYEGLLDHTAVRASEPVLGIKGTRSKEPEIPLATLEALLAQGQDKLIDLLRDETGRSVPAIRRALQEVSMLDEHKLRIACDHDEALLARLRPFAGLVREDSFERPLVVLAGCVYVTAGTTRRSTGTHYTPPSLTEPIVQHALEPLVYEGPAKGWSREQWKLKSPRAILNLKVCDMAMGSGAFLVQACRYLAERLVEAWENEEKHHPGEVLITPDGKFSEGAASERLVPADANERLAIARRVVADRCLYGSDINPMAVEMAKLSLWLITVDRDRPFTFLDHAFKCGDSLLGITSLAQLENFSLRPGGGKQQAFAMLNLGRNIGQAMKKREALEAMPSDTREQILAKATLCAEAEDAVATLNAAADVLVAMELKGLMGNVYEAERQTSADEIVLHWSKGLPELESYAQTRSRGRRCIHWVLAFPEIAGRGGFDAFVGNPPFLGAMRIAQALGDDYQRFLKLVWNHRKGAADLVAYFFLRAFTLLSRHGNLGIIATNTLPQGNTRAVGLDYIVATGGTIYNAVKSMSWPGTANVFISIAHIHKDEWRGSKVLDGNDASNITSALDDVLLTGEPKTLENLPCYSSRGTTVLGIGFVITPEEAIRLKSIDPRNDEILYPYLNAVDFSTSPDLSATRQVINFHDWSLEVAKSYGAPFKIVFDTVRPQREKPQRQVHEVCYWKFSDKRPELYSRIQPLSEVLVCGMATKYFAFAFVPSRQIFADKVGVFATDDRGIFAALSSSIHEAWAIRYMYTLKGDPCYSLSACYQTFPTCIIGDNLRQVGLTYHEFRRQLMLNRREGLTKTYNRFHDPKESSEDISRLRVLRLEMDHAVAHAYGWRDLDFDHGFRETRQGIRYTISESARREGLDRLLALNHQRHASEGAERASLPAATLTKRGRKKNGGGQMAIAL